MKKIKLTYFSPKRKDTNQSKLKKYSIFSGPGTWQRFNNKKDAEKYLAELSRTYSIILDELVHYTAETYAELWRFWYNSDTGEQHFFNRFRQIEEITANIIYRCNYQNSDSAYHVRMNLLKIIRELLSILNYMTQIRRQKNRHGENRTCKVYKRNLERLKADLV